MIKEVGNPAEIQQLVRNIQKVLPYPGLEKIEQVNYSLNIIDNIDLSQGCPLKSSISMSQDKGRDFSGSSFLFVDYIESVVGSIYAIIKNSTGELIKLENTAKIIPNEEVGKEIMKVLKRLQPENLAKLILAKTQRLPDPYVLEHGFYAPETPRFDIISEADLGDFYIVKHIEGPNYNGGQYA